MRIVLDTNVIVSGIFFAGVPGKIVALVGQHKLVPCFTVVTWEELERVLFSEKFEAQRSALSFAMGDFLYAFQTRSLIFPSVPPPRVITDDPADNYILASALVSGASCIVSGDVHLKRLRVFRNVPVMSPSAFLKEFSA